MCRKRFVHLILSAVLFGSGSFLSAQEIQASGGSSIPEESGEILWYRSNASGLALELIPSRLAALRNEYCLSVERIRPVEIPQLLPGRLLPFYDYTFSAELRIIYEKGKEYRCQWIFRDDRGHPRLTASGSDNFFGGENSTGEKSSGFIEIRDAEALISRELRYEDDLSEWEFRYYYKGNILLTAETLFKEPPVSAPAKENSSPPAVNGQDENGKEASQETVAGESTVEPVFVHIYTDYYRYSRSGSLRAIDRVILEGGGTKSRINFPQLGPRLSAGDKFFTQGVAYTSKFLQDITIPEAAKVNYTFDSRGRILTEVWKDADDKYLGEFRNTWSADRLESVLWKSNDEERLVEYEYDSSGNRIAERNFRQGVLERSVTSRDGKDVEEIYMDGKLILRAYWVNGLKISEERVSPAGRESRPGRKAADLPGETPR